MIDKKECCPDCEAWPCTCPETLECIVCGKTEKLIWMEGINKALAKTNRCFSCNHWIGLILLKNKTIRVDGHHYMVGPEAPTGPIGFGGRKFKVKFNDGRVIETKNLWHQGEIPEHFKTKIPNNAVFIHDFKKRKQND